MNKLLILAALVVVALLAGCTSAGPYITSIQPDGRGNIIVEREMLRYAPLTGPLMPIGRLGAKRIAPLTIRISPENDSSKNN